jgi:protein TonB
MMAHGPGHPAPGPLGYALLLALAVHGALLLGVGFVPEPPGREVGRQQSLRVVLVHPRPDTPKPVDEPDLAAQLSQEGAGPSEQSAPAHRIPVPQVPAQPRSSPPPPAPPPPRVLKEPEPAARPEPEVPTRTASRIPKPQSSRPRESARPPAPRPTPPVEESPPPRITAAQLLASRGEEVARLTAELERKSAAYAQRPRRRAISATTKEYRYAAYLEAWRQKVERIGNLNYPDEARRQQLFGDLVLHVAVRSDGSVERINLLHSSGHKVLDDAAIRIVRLAAPFAPFPQDIAQEVDVLDITRTWQFLSGNRLNSKD